MSFAEAEAAFVEFLEEHTSQRGPVAWFFHGDITSSEQSVWLKWPLPAANRRRVEEIYTSWKDRAPVRLDAQFVVKGRLCATIWLPRPGDTPSSQTEPGLSFSCASPLTWARPVSSTLRWSWLQWRNGDPPRSGWCSSHRFFADTLTDQSLARASSRKP